jgi:hypothetical protein
VRAERVAVAIPEQVEAGAAADLEQPQGQLRGARHRQEAAEQRGAAAHLVGLHLGVESWADLGRVSLDHAGEGVPGGGPDGRSAERRVIALELRSPTFEGEALHRAYQALRQRVEQGLALPVREQAGERAAALELRDAALHQTRRQLGARLAAAADLRAKGVEDFAPNHGEAPRARSSASA